MKKDVFQRINDEHLNLRRSGTTNLIIRLALIDPNIIIVTDPHYIADLKNKFAAASKPFFRIDQTEVEVWPKFVSIYGDLTDINREGKPIFFDNTIILEQD